MLYLEDYLEMIEHLPQELRDRFTEMREMDLSVQNNMDTLEKRVRTLFGGCRRGEINTDQANTEFTDIKRGYNKTLEEADEKVTLANQMYDLVDRYLRRLDTELHKFKCELEADNKGVTELLEKRSLDLDTNTNHTSTSNNNHYKDSRYRIRAEKRRDSWATRDSRAHQSNGSISRSESAIPAALGRDSYSLGHAGSAIAAAASQAIAATQQMQQGRRTASLKASYEAVAGELAHQAHHHAHHSHHDHSQTIPTAHTQSTSAHSTSTTSSNKRHTKQKKSTYSSSSNVSSLHSQQSVSAAASRSSSPTVGAMSTVVNNVAIEEPMEEEWTYDPNEPRYCICNQVSYGDMVACDNQDCPYEWFHYPCVGITAPPKGKWYCPQCQTNMRRNRAHRKN
ncbi:inhibitor of growth protein 3 [Vanessa tameamea]|uniref:Inhibitor of growth protein n=1 Tax=Vanessa tameamea TaxID=334116 RepID=A0A8B8IJ20_VANTA|nr:inhibitor of growth protein 3 [Vanessa tameamea]XP_047535312.1 inhibitor of growth protein 3 [Vanessa atalanta]